MKIVILILRLPLLFVFLVLICWHFSNEYQKAHYLPWVSQGLHALLGDQLPSYFQLPFAPDSFLETSTHSQQSQPTSFAEYMKNAEALNAGTLQVKCKKTTTAEIVEKKMKVFSVFLMMTHNCIQSSKHLIPKIAVFCRSRL